jgi:acyl-coenzyme A synthetase/AMP-(fatty) acid ligase
MSRVHELTLGDGDARLSYADLDARGDRLAAGLAGRGGTGRGDRIVGLEHNSFRVVELLLASARIGGYPGQT